MAKFLNNRNEYVVIADEILLESLRKRGREGFTTLTTLFMQVADDTDLKCGKVLKKKLQFLYYKFVKSTLPAKKLPAKKLSPRQATHVDDDDSLKYHFNDRTGRRLISFKEICSIYKEIMAAHGTSPQIFRGRKACMELGIPPSSYNVSKITHLEIKILESSKEEAVRNESNENSSLSNIVVDDKVLPLTEGQMETAECEEKEINEDSKTSIVEEEDCDKILSSSKDSASIEVPPKKGDIIKTFNKGPNTFCFDGSVWEALKSGQKGRRFSDRAWPDKFATHIKKYNPFCSFSYSYHTVRGSGKFHGGRAFFCYGRCAFSPKCPVTIKITITCEKSLQGFITFGAGHCVHPAGITKGRYIRGSTRQQLGKELQLLSPAAYSLQCLEQVPQEAIKAGNRDGLPTCQVMSGIKYQFKASRRPHKVEVLSLLALGSEKITSMYDVKMNWGYSLPYVMLWSSASLYILKRRMETDIIYIAATDGVVKAREKPFYAYDVVVRNKVAGERPLSVATYVTMDRTATSICYFMSKLRDEVGRNSSRPKMVMFDGSHTILSAILSFLLMSLSECLGAYYRIVTGQATQSDLNVTILRLCVSHVSKNAKLLCLKSFGQHLYKVGMHIIGAIGRSESMKEIEDILEAMEILFHSKYQSDRVIEAHDFLESKFYTHPDDPMLDIKEVKDTENEYKSKHPLSKKYNSGFVTRFNQAMKEDDVEDEGIVENVFFNVLFLQKFKDDFLPTIPLWSNLLLGDLGRHGNGSVYDEFSKKFGKRNSLTTQNYTRDNRTQEVVERNMELHIRLDDFTINYKDIHKRDLLEFCEKAHLTIKENCRESKKVEADT